MYTCCAYAFMLFFYLFDISVYNVKLIHAALHKTFVLSNPITSSHSYRSLAGIMVLSVPGGPLYGRSEGCLNGILNPWA